MTPTPARWAAGGLVALVRVEGELAQELAGGGVDDADVQVLDQEQDAGSGIRPADADVVEAVSDSEEAAPHAVAIPDEVEESAGTLEERDGTPADDPRFLAITDDPVGQPRRDR